MKRQIVIDREGKAPAPVANKAPAPKREFGLVKPLLCMLVAAGVASTLSSTFEDELARYVPETMTDTSTYNKKPTGYAGCFELSEKLKNSTKRWQRPYRDLQEPGTLVVMGPSQFLQDFEIEQILKWVKEGNDLVYMDFFTFRITGKSLLERLSLKAIESANLTDSAFTPVKDPLCEHVDKLNVSAETRLVQTDGSLLPDQVVPETSKTPDAHHDGYDNTPTEEAKQTKPAKATPKVIASDKNGALIIEVPYGKGRCLVSVAPNLCCNRRIADPESKGNFQLLANCLKNSPGTVYFDEKCHGFSSTPGIFAYLSKGPVGLAAAQILLIFAVALLSLNQRFGPVKRVSNPRRISNLEFIDGMAHTYRKAKASDTAWSILFVSFKTRLCKALGAAPETPTEELANSWAEITGLTSKECNEFLTRAIKAESTHITNEELLELVASCDRLSEQSKQFISITASRRLSG